MIARELFLRRALLLPLALPIAVGGLGLLAPEVFGVLGVLLAGSLAYGGMAYTIFALGMYWWTRDHPYPAIKRLAFLAPLLFAPLAGGNMALFFVFGAPGAVRATDRLVQDFLSGAAFALVFGYLYVLLAFIAERARHRSAYLTTAEVQAARSRDGAI